MGFNIGTSDSQSDNPDTSVQIKFADNTSPSILKDKKMHGGFFAQKSQKVEIQKSRQSYS